MSRARGRGAGFRYSCSTLMPSPASITFLGAAGTVTGSKHLLEVDGHRVLVDCGLFQGLKELRLRNWEPPPVDPASIEAVVLTHAHLDHCGYLPKLVSAGFRGRIFCTPGTKELCSLVLPDAAHIQEEDARDANRHGFSKHQPGLHLGGCGARARSPSSSSAACIRWPRAPSGSIRCPRTPTRTRSCGGSRVSRGRRA